MELLSRPDREGMGPFVQKRTEDSKRRVLDDWDGVQSDKAD